MTSVVEDRARYIFSYPMAVKSAYILRLRDRGPFLWQVMSDVGVRGKNGVVRLVCLELEGMGVFTGTSTGDLGYGMGANDRLRA